jgi:hypothetical protein
MRSEMLPVVLPLYTTSLSAILAQLGECLRDLAATMRTGDAGYHA